jgi:hypothetical protein
MAIAFLPIIQKHRDIYLGEVSESSSSQEAIYSLVNFSFFKKNCWTNYSPNMYFGESQIVVTSICKPLSEWVPKHAPSHWYSI